LTAGEKLSDHRAGGTTAPAAETKSVQAPAPDSRSSATAPGADAPGGNGMGMREVREARKREAAERNARAKARRERETALSRAEEAVAQLERRQAELVAALEDPGSYEDPAIALRLNRELGDVGRDIAKATAAWEKLAEETAAEAAEETSEV
jgi:hypothetical protein